mgnify:CR=1 FL=1
MALDGLLLIDKPAGLTSFDVVRRVRQALNYALDVDAIIREFKAISRRSGPTAREHSRLVIGPWHHVAVGKPAQGELIFADVRVPEAGRLPRGRCTVPARKPPFIGTLTGTSAAVFGILSPSLPAPARRRYWSSGRSRRACTRPVVHR